MKHEFKFKKIENHLAKLEKIEAEYEEVINSIVKKGENFIVHLDEEEARSKAAGIMRSCANLISIVLEYRKVFPTQGLTQSLLNVKELISSGLSTQEIEYRIKKLNLIESQAEIRSKSNHSLKLDKLIELTVFPDEVEDLIVKIQDNQDSKAEQWAKYITVNGEKLEATIPQEDLDQILEDTAVHVKHEDLDLFLKARKMADILNIAAEHGAGFRDYPSMSGFKDLLNTQGQKSRQFGMFNDYQVNTSRFYSHGIKEHKLVVIRK